MDGLRAASLHATPRRPRDRLKIESGPRRVAGSGPLARRDANGGARPSSRRRRASPIVAELSR